IKPEISMRFSLQFLLCSCVSICFFFSCGKQRSPFEISPVERLDPNRINPPYPLIQIPGDADLESPRWKGISLTPAPPVVPRSALEQLGTFILKQGYKIEPVLTEPHIKEPAAIQFDGNGRMYVLELRSYM